MKLDLHLHSLASDGCLGVRQLTSLAGIAGLDGFALTDHDWTGHLDEAAAIAAEAGLHFVGGVEISACDPQTGRPVHILGYHLGSASPAVAAVCAPVLAARHRTVLDTLDWLARHGLALSLEEVEEIAWGGGGDAEALPIPEPRAETSARTGTTVWTQALDRAGPGLLDRSPVLYRQHVVEALRRRGLPVSALGDLEKKFRQPGGPWTGDRCYPSPIDALAAIKADGGLAVLAHPGLSQVWDLVPGLSDAGLDGIEVDHPAHAAADRQLAAELCPRYRLFATGGSDFHGDYPRQGSGSGEPAGAEVSGGRDAASPAATRDPEGNGAFPGAGLCPRASVVYFGHARGRELRFAENLVRKAGDWLRTEREAAFREETGGAEVDQGQAGPGIGLDASLGVFHKEGDHRDLVSRCDHAVDALVRDAVGSVWPGHLLLTEEGDSPAAIGDEPLWILDPVDGTTNFLKSGRDWAVSLALWQGGKPCFGLVLEGQNDQLHLAVPGLGFWTEGRLIGGGGQARAERIALADGHTRAAVHLPATGLPQEADFPWPADEVPASLLAGTVLDASLNTFTDLAKRGVDLEELNRLICGHRSCGCASLALVRLASGSLDAFVSAKLRVWDWAAGVIMLQESGGTWTGLHGRHPDPRDPGKCPFLAGRTPGTVEALRMVLDRPASSEQAQAADPCCRRA